MKYLLILIFLISSALIYASESTISGTVSNGIGCADKAMVWLSLDKENYKERLLLMHTEVPKGGSFKFYVRPGAYQIRATDQEDCEYLEKIVVKNKDFSMKVELVKK